LSFEESLSSLKPLSFQATDVDLSIEAKNVLHLTLKMYQMSAVENLIPNLRSAVISAISKYVTASTNHILHTWNQDLANASTKSDSDSQEINKILTEAFNELSEIWKNVHAVVDSNDNGFAFAVDEELPTTKILVELFNRCFPYYKNFSLLDLQCPSQVVYIMFTLIFYISAKFVFNIYLSHANLISEQMVGAVFEFGSPTMLLKGELLLFY
jgi:hypothetical protein